MTLVRRIEQSADRSRTNRFLALAMMTLVLALRLGIWGRHVMDDVHEILGGTESHIHKIGSLMFIDFFLLISGACLVLFLGAMAIGYPDKSGSRFPIRFLRGRFVLVFLSTGLLAALLLLAAPWWIADRVLTMNPTPNFPLYPHHLPPAYLRASLLTALAIGLSTADSATKSMAPRSWRLLFFLPFPAFDTFALLWGNAAACLLPSRYWRVWRPFLAAITLSGILLAYPASQPFRERSVLFHPDALRYSETLCRQNAYQAIAAPGGDDAYVRCGYGLAHAHREASGWKRAGFIELGFLFNQGAFDFAGNRGFFLDPNHNRVTALRLTDLIPTATWEIPRTILDLQGSPMGESLFFQSAHGGEGRVLIWGWKDGNYIAFRSEDFGFQGRFHLNPGLCTGVAYDRERDELMFIVDGNLFIIRGDSLRLVKSASWRTKPRAYGVFPDPPRRRFFVCFPELCRLAAYDSETLALLDSWPAPAGVRTLAVDEQRGLIFLGAISGVLEVRTLADLRPVARVRLLTWTHWLEAFPKHGEILVTAGELAPMFWRYDPPDVRFDPADRVLQIIEAGIRFVTARSKPVDLTLTVFRTSYR